MTSRIATSFLLFPRVSLLSPRQWTAFSASAISALYSAPSRPIARLGVRTFATSKPAGKGQQQQLSRLTWTQYFELKKKARNFELASSVASFAVFFVGGTYYFLAVKEFDPTELVFGVMDASIAYSLGAFAVAGIGAVVGIFAGSALWRLTTDKQILQAIDGLDKEFFLRVKKYRPQGQLRLSLQDPLPDYYAENVKSVADYRTWLKKQRNYRIKTEGFKAMRSNRRKSA